MHCLAEKVILVDTYKIKQWLLHKDSHYELRAMELFQNLILLAVCILIFFAIYSNADTLNAEPILIFRLGGIILLALLAGIFIFTKKVFVNLKYGFKGAPNIVKLIVLLFLLNAAIFAYQNQEEIGKFFEEKNTDKLISKLSPIFFSPNFSTNPSLENFSKTFKSLSEFQTQTECEKQAYNINSKQWECFEEKSVSQQNTDFVP